MINNIFFIFLFLFMLFFFAKFLGYYLSYFVYDNESLIFLKFEKFLWSYVLRNVINAYHKMEWKEYAISLITFNLLGGIFLFLLLINQENLPLNPQKFSNLNWDLAFNIAISFVTSTNWQSYTGENTLSYFSQMVGLSVQNFFSSATGISVSFVIMRAFIYQNTKILGNAWVDLMRVILYLLLPLSFVFALFLVSQGVIQNFSPYLLVHTLNQEIQTIPMGPVASQEAIKLLGNNGGGFFSANSSHPFENPTELCNFFQMLAILLIPTALCFTFGIVVGNKKQGLTLIWTMTIILCIAFMLTFYSEISGNPILQSLGANSNVNMEGKENRFGILNSVFYAVITTATSCGAINSMHDSFTPLGGMVPMCLIQLGEIVFGGAGSGLYCMLLFVILTVFVAFFIIGQIPNYLGKKIEIQEIKLSIISIIIPPCLILLGSTLAFLTDTGKISIFNPGYHGFTEILYTFSSVANNNGSAFAGLNANNLFYNILLGIIMLIGRFGLIIPVISIASTIMKKKHQFKELFFFPTHGPLFIGLLIFIIFIISGLTFIPALILGPISEYINI